MRTNILLAATVLLAAAAWAQDLRGTAVRLVSVDAREDLQPSATLKVEEILAIGLSGETRFLEGLIVEIVLAEEVKRYADSFAVTVYASVSPQPDTEQLAYSGRRVLFRVLPYTNRLYVQLPLTRTVSSAGPEVAVATPLAPGEFPVLLAISPVMKGIPDSVLERSFYATIKPQVARRGLLDLRVVRPDGYADEPVTVLLGGREVRPEQGPLEVEAGVHGVEVVSQAFRRATASVAIAPGQKTAVVIELESASSHLTMELLTGAQVFLDGERIELQSGQKLELTEGTHTIRFRLGEASISRKFDVKAGRNYQVSLVLDVVLKEEEKTR